MPSSDYANAVGGGLKLKGAKDAGVKKQKKKQRKDKSLAIADKSDADDSTSAAPRDEPVEDMKDESVAERATEGDDKELRVESGAREFGKTEAQRRHEERRRKMLEAKFEQQGVKTHKERVEALNKYLSGLSEHHDMPRIGPG